MTQKSLTLDCPEVSLRITHSAKPIVR